MKQASSDPLPFVQVDRAIESTTALLAGHMKVSTQHALGSLVAFWKMCADPRELEKVVATTPPGHEPEVVLAGEVVAMRFRLASDREIEPSVLTHLGVLEARPDDAYRVRGMSRYFKAIENSKRARAIAAAGGKASAESRKKTFGSAQPQSNRQFNRPEPRLEAQPELLPNSSRTVVRTAVEPTPEPKPNRPPNTDVRRQTSESKEDPESAKSPPIQPLLELVGQAPKKPRPRPAPDPKAEFERFVATLTPDEGKVFEAYETAMGVELGADWGLRKFVGQKLKAHTADELCAAIRGHASDTWRREHSPSIRAILRDSTVIATLAKQGRGAA